VAQRTRTHQRRRADLDARRSRRAEVDDPSIVMDAAALFLAVRPRSVEETRRRLRRLGHPHALSDQVIERLIEMRYLDDMSFARAWVESRDRVRPRGAIALRRELGQKGVSLETITLVLDERAEANGGGSGDGSEQHAGADRWAAERLLARRSASLLREPGSQKRRQKAYLLLARNGFSPDLCRDLAETFTRDSDAGATESV
jgi:regulatory protein